MRQLFTPWWRVVWLVGGIVWLLGFNVVYIATGARNEWFGIISVVPVMALLVDVIVRDRRSRSQ
jgi:hypothetical protein